MKTWHLKHQAGEGSATWTVTLTTAGDPVVYTITPAMGLDTLVTGDSIAVEKDATDVTPALSDEYNTWTLYLRDDFQAFPVKEVLPAGSFGVLVFLWAYLGFKLAS